MPSLKDKLKVTYRKVKDLKHYKNNPRIHTDDQIAQIVGSINEFGFTSPILLDGKNTILAGHGRVMAAEAMGMDTVPTIDLSGLTAKQKEAYVIADNKLTENASWDYDILKTMIPDMDDSLRDLIGFSNTEINQIFRTTAVPNEDDVPDVPEASRVQYGDIWQLGRHRLMCGDATKADDVEKLYGDKNPVLMVTDPPYGVNYDPDWRNRADRANGRHSADRATIQVNNDNRIDWSEAYKLFTGDVVYIWHAGLHANLVAQSLLDSGFIIRCQIIWAKNNIVIGRGNYHTQHEPCWYAVRNSKKANWSGGRKQSTLWEIDKPMKSETGHSTQKPIECMRRPILNNSMIGDIVYDPFIGSGTTIIAAETTERICYAMDIDPICCEITIKRWEDFTGGEAVKL